LLRLKFQQVNQLFHSEKLLSKHQVDTPEIGANLDMVALKDSSIRRGTVTITSPTGDVTIRIRTRPLPSAVTSFLLKHAESMQHFLLDRRSRIEEDVDLAAERITVAERLSITDFKKALEEILVAEGGEWKSIIDR
jgi:hypothetical protein